MIVRIAPAAIVTLVSGLVLGGMGTAGILPSNDAGRGVDAPDAPTASFAVVPRAVYHGNLSDKLPDRSADRDWYALPVVAGTVVQVEATYGSCWKFFVPGEALTSTCLTGGVTSVRAHPVSTSGTGYLLVWDAWSTLSPYSFSIGVGERPLRAGGPSNAPFHALEDLT